MCVGCGYMMDAVSCVTTDRAPTAQDICLCMNCGKPYRRLNGAWVVPTAAWMEGLPAYLRLDLLRHQIVRGIVIDRDLTRRDGKPSRSWTV
jgi:hypothetical protein